MKFTTSLLLILIATCMVFTTYGAVIDGSNIAEFFANGGKLPEPQDTTPQYTPDELLSMENEIYQGLLDDLEKSPSNIIEEEEAHTSLSAYDLITLQRRAAYSSIARCLAVNVKSITNWSCTWCNDGKVPKLTQVSGGLTTKSNLGWFTGYDKANNLIILAFKSTGGWQNWILNLDAVTTDYPACPGCKAHRGFFLGFKDELLPVIVPALNQLRKDHPTAKLQITGHSLGGAMTTHAVIAFKNGIFASTNFHGIEIYHDTNGGPYNDLSDHQFTQLHSIANNQSYEHSKLQLFSHNNLRNSAIVEHQNNGVDGTSYPIQFPIFNFGSPRVFNPEGANFFNSQIPTTMFRRTTHCLDTVTHVPLYHMNFRHVGQEIYFYNKNLSPENRECSASDSEDKACSFKDIALDPMQHKWYGGYSMLQEDSDCK